MVSTINGYWLRQEAKRTCPFLERIDINWNGGDMYEVNGICTKDHIRKKCSNKCPEIEKASRIDLLCDELSLISDFKPRIK